MSAHVVDLTDPGPGVPVVKVVARGLQAEPSGFETERLKRRKRKSQAKRPGGAAPAAIEAGRVRGTHPSGCVSIHAAWMFDIHANRISRHPVPLE